MCYGRTDLQRASFISDRACDVAYWQILLQKSVEKALEA